MEAYGSADLLKAVPLPVFTQPSLLKTAILGPKLANISLQNAHCLASFWLKNDKETCVN
jgi:hypothetical protein